MSKTGMLVLSLLGLAATVAGTPRAVHAQTCDVCNTSFGEHYFAGTPSLCSPGEEGESGCFDCSSTPEGHIGCHAAHVTGECSPSGHEPCGGVIEFAATDEQFLLEAVRAGDAAAVTRIMDTYSEWLSLNVGRQALQFHDCSGAVVSHIPLPSALFVMVESREPRAMVAAVAARR